MTTDVRDDDDDTRELERYANAGAQPNQPRGQALVQPTRALTPIGAQLVARMRDESAVRRKLTELAAMAGDDWFYRFPVRDNRTGQTTWIEGPSIKLANSVALIYGNCITEVREMDVGDAWTFYARFTDLESGFSMERAYRQRKGQATIKTKDAQRSLDQVYQIGQSKAIRNVIVNSLQIWADYAFEQAQGSLVTKIGKDLEAWRGKALEALARIPVELHRVERVVGRAQKDWLATDIARIVAMGKAVSDGMATADETFPPDVAVSSAAPTAQQPGSAKETTAAPSDTDSPSAKPSPNGPSPGAPAGRMSAEPPPEKPKPQTVPRSKDEYLALVRTVCFAAKSGETLRAWFVSDQQRKIRNGAGMTATDTQEARELVLARIRELEGA
jgi:hypothetical protein